MTSHHCCVCCCVCGGQAFLAVLTLELATSAGNSDFDISLRLYRQIAGYSMLGCAGLYILGGMLCFGALKQGGRWQEGGRGGGVVCVCAC